MKINLSGKQIEEFYDIGFLKIDGVFSESEINEMEKEIDIIKKIAMSLKSNKEKIMYCGSQFVLGKFYDGKKERQIKRVIWCGAIRPSLLKFGRDSRLTSIASQIMNCNQANHLINQIHFKFPNDGVFYPFHQDSQHRHYGTKEWVDVNGLGSYIQIITAIDKSTLENAPLMFIPGSRKRGHLNLPYKENNETISEFFDAKDAVPALLNPGDVVAFGPYTIHGSYENKSNFPRRVFINGFSYPGANKRKYPGKGAGKLINLDDKLL